MNTLQSLGLGLSLFASTVVSAQVADSSGELKDTLTQKNWRDSFVSGSCFDLMRRNPANLPKSWIADKNGLYKVKFEPLEDGFKVLVSHLGLLTSPSGIAYFDKEGNFQSAELLKDFVSTDIQTFQSYFRHVPLYITDFFLGNDYYPDK